MCGLAPADSILSYWSTYLLLYEYQVLLIISALKYVLKFDIVKSPSLFLLFKLALVVWNYVSM